MILINRTWPLPLHSSTLLSEGRLSAEAPLPAPIQKGRALSQRGAHEGQPRKLARLN